MKKKIYPQHPCIQCGTATVNKNYCDKHLALARTGNMFLHSKKSLIWADTEGSKTGRRRENVNALPQM